MSFKIDTKEKFTVITPENNVLDANIAGKLWEAAISCMNEEPGNVILNFENITEAQTDAVNDLASLHQHMYDNKRSFVICHVSPAVINVMQNEDITDQLNITPTESEAWDVVQMEEIERELMDDFE